MLAKIKNFFNKLFGAKKENIEITVFDKAATLYANDEISLKTYERMSHMLFNDVDFRIAKSNASSEARYLEYFHTHKDNNFSPDNYVLPPKVGEILHLFVDDEYINDVRNWGGEDNERYADALQAEMTNGPFFKPMVYRGFGDFWQSKNLTVKTSQDRLGFPENEDVLFDVSEVDDTEAMPINRSYFVDNLVRLDSSEVLSEPINRNHSLVGNPIAESVNSSQLQLDEGLQVPLFSNKEAVIA